MSFELRPVECCDFCLLVLTFKVHRVNPDVLASAWIRGHDHPISNRDIRTSKYPDLVKR